MKMLLNLVLMLAIISNLFASEAQNVISYGAGVFEIDAIVLDTPHALLEGKGRGVTILKVKNGILANAPEPIIRDITLVGAGSNTGITLKNTWSANVENVEIENYDTGMHIVLDAEGRKKAGGSTKNHWPGALTKGEHWGSRVTLTDIRNVEITGKGNGIFLENLLPKGNRGQTGEFFTATTIWGGHIKVDGVGVEIGDNVWNTKIIGTYIDIGTKSGILLQEHAWDLKLVAVVIDLPAYKKKLFNNDKIKAKSWRAKKYIQLNAMDMDEDEIRLELVR